MAEFWASAGGASLISAGSSILGGILGGKSAEKKAKAEAKFKATEDRALMADEAKYGAINKMFNSQVDDYYNQLQRQRKQRGLDQFRSFNTVNNYAQGYADGPGVVLPTAPTMQSYNDSITTANMSKPTKL